MGKNFQFFPKNISNCGGESSRLPLSFLMESGRPAWLKKEEKAAKKNSFEPNDPISGKLCMAACASLRLVFFQKLKSIAVDVHNFQVVVRGQVFA